MEKSTLKVAALWILLLFVSYQVAVLSVYGANTTSFVIVSFLIIILLSYVFWKKAVVFLIFWVLIAGAVRKWLLPDAEDKVFLFGHAMLVGIYIKYFQERLLTRLPLFIKHPLNIFLLFLFAWGVACVFNPDMGNVLVGVLGLVIYFYYIPLAYIIPQVISSRDELIKLLKVFVIVSVPILILGIVQFFSPVEHPINTYVREVNFDIALVGKYPRVTSTFAYISGFAVYLSMLILIMVYLLSLKEKSLRFTIFLYITIIIASFCLMMTGSRGPVIYTLLESVLFLFIAGVFSLRFIKRFLLNIILVGLFAFLFFQITSIGKTVVDAFTYRASYSEDIGPRLINTYLDPFRFFKYVGVYGLGIGSTYQGAIALGHDPFKNMHITGGFEEEQGRIVIEVGFFGYFLIFFIRILIIKFFWDLFRKLKNEDLKLFSLTCMLFLLPFSFGLANLIFDYTSNIFYWYTIGFLFLLPQLDQKISYSTSSAKK